MKKLQHGYVHYFYISVNFWVEIDVMNEEKIFEGPVPANFFASKNADTGISFGFTRVSKHIKLDKK